MPRWASWVMELRLSPSEWAWTGRSAQTLAGNEAEMGKTAQSNVSVNDRLCSISFILPC